MPQAVTQLVDSSLETPVRHRWLSRRQIAAALIVLLLLSAIPVGIRWYRLSWLPNVPAPFDYEAVGKIPNPADVDANFYFEQALAQHERSRADFDPFDRFVEHGEPLDWSSIPEADRDWVRRSQPALDTFRQGGRCPTIATSSPSDATNAAQIYRLRGLWDLHRLACLDALRRLDEGETEEAAEVLHDAFRASRHLGYRSPWIERHLGAICHLILLPGWHQWSRHPDVSAEDLEQALARLRNDWKLTPRFSESIKSEFRPSLDRSSVSTHLQTLLDQQIWRFVDRHGKWDSRPVTSRLNSAFPGWQNPILWTIGEPELTMRASKLWMTHELQTCDLPFSRQSFCAGHRIQVSLDPELTAGLTPAEMSRRMEQVLFPQIVMSLSPYLETYRTEAGRQAVLETAFELQILLRRFGNAERTVAEPTLANFAWPVDPCSRDERPIQHRLTDQGLLIWSIGRDADDDDGHHSSVRDDHQDDELAFIRWPYGQ